MAGPSSLAAVGAIRNIPVVRCRFQVETDQEGRMDKERTHSEILDRCRDKFIKEETMTKKLRPKMRSRYQHSHAIILKNCVEATSALLRRRLRVICASSQMHEHTGDD
jgi:hypothetical protein